MLSMLQNLDIGPLVPDIYAEYRPAIAGALRFFLGHLSPHRLQDIMLDQASLPADTELSTRLVHFMHHCPALHKLGQVVARNRHLDPAFRKQLQRLESMEPRTPLDRILPMVRRQLRSASPRPQIGRRALAEASVAVVLPMTWSGRECVAKVLKPGIEARLHEDLHIFSLLADHMDVQRRQGVLPPIEYRQTFEDVRQLLSSEVLLHCEQQHLSEARRFYAARKYIAVPEPLPVSTRRLTAMTFLPGRKVTEAGASRHFAENIARALVADVLFSPAERVMFHADPHAGNLLAMPDGALGVLDWSLVGHLQRQQRLHMMQIVLAAAGLDEPRVRSAIDALAGQPLKHDLLDRHVPKGLGDVKAGRLPGFTWLMNLMDGLAREGALFPTDLLLFRKTIFTLDGVIHDLCPSASLEAILTSSLIEQLAREWPARWFLPPGEPAPATHVSNLDLLHLAARLPLTFANWSAAAMRR